MLAAVGPALTKAGFDVIVDINEARRFRGAPGQHRERRPHLSSRAEDQERRLHGPDKLDKRIGRRGQKIEQIAFRRRDELPFDRDWRSVYHRTRSTFPFSAARCNGRGAAEVQHAARSGCRFGQ